MELGGEGKPCTCALMVVFYCFLLFYAGSQPIHSLQDRSYFFNYILLWIESLKLLFSEALAREIVVMLSFLSHDLYNFLISYFALSDHVQFTQCSVLYLLLFKLLLFLVCDFGTVVILEVTKSA